ncbi:hypothetical protein KAR91_86365 [Candidatus Pacearchaeota archaeon]|nr:hypothetical protein [Candidatus Pacearchaeota archaeon]
MSNTSYWTPKRKRDVARRMVESGHKNDEIKDHLKKKVGSAISSEALAEIRATIGKSGPNRKKKTNGKVKSANTVRKSLAKKKAKLTKEDVIFLQGQELDPHFKELLSNVRSVMGGLGIQKIELDCNGNVKATQLQDVHVRV